MVGQAPAAEPADLTDGRRWMGVGHSSHPEGRQAGAEATAVALHRPDAKLLIVFASVLYDLPAVLAGANDISGGIPLIGCTTHGEISPWGTQDGSVVVAAVGGDGFSVTTAAQAHVSGRQREAGVELATAATAAGDEPRPYQVLIMLTDGLTRDQETILRGAYEVVGAGVPLFGGAAGDASRMERTFQFHGRDVISDGAVAAYLCSDAPLAVAIGHGWSRVGEAMVVTAAAAGRVQELDDQPALDTYLRRFDAPPEAYSDPAAFTAFALSRPVGVQRRSGEKVRNFSTEMGLHDRSVGGGIGICPGSLIWPMTSSTESILDAVDRTFADAVAGLKGRSPIGYLTFSCAALRAVIGDTGVAAEAARLSAQAKGVPYAGFYTYGEIARTRGIDGFHNQTFVALALA